MAFGDSNIAHQPCHALPRFNVGYEQPIFPAQGNLTHQLLDAIVIDRNLAVAEYTLSAPNDCRYI